MDGLEELVEELVGVEPPVFSMSLGEWLTRSLGVFSDTLAFVMDTPLLRFFAVFGVMWVVFSLLAYMVRSGKALSR